MSEGKKRGPKPKAKRDRIVAYPLGITGAQKAHIERQARLEGLNPSEYLRLLIDKDISELG